MRSMVGAAGAALLGVIVACSGTSTDANPPPPDAADTAGSDEPDEPAGSDEPDEPAGEPYVRPTSADETTLLGCTVPEPCVYTSLAQITEGANNVISLEGSRCVLEALAQGTPGRYVHQTEHTYGNGNLGAEHTLVVTGDRSVLYTRVPYGAVFVPDGYGATYSTHDEPVDPAQRCTLKPPSYFDACLVAVDATPRSASRVTLAYECVFGDGSTSTTSHLEWFESCVTESPLSCE